NHNAPYGVWAAAFLNKIGAPTCFDNLVTMVAWQVQEGTTANWNPLATTYPMDGASNFNSVGVKNYVSMDQGLEAWWRTLDVQSTWRLMPVRDCAAATDARATIFLSVGLHVVLVAFPT